MAKQTDQSRHLRQKDIIDREERAQFRRQGVELAPRWRQVIGPTPVLEKGDIAGATLFLTKIEAAIAGGGWTMQERNGLKRLRRKWRRKADGKDEWFMMAGNPYGGDRIQYYGGVKNQNQTGKGDDGTRIAAEEEG